jgi:hypothetical protein
MPTPIQTIAVRLHVLPIGGGWDMSWIDPRELPACITTGALTISRERPSGEAYIAENVKTQSLAPAVLRQAQQYESWGEYLN